MTRFFLLRFRGSGILVPGRAAFLYFCCSIVFLTLGSIAGGADSTSSPDKSQTTAFQFHPDKKNPLPECERAVKEHKLYKEVADYLIPWTLDPQNNSDDLPPAFRLVFRCL